MIQIMEFHSQYIEDAAGLFTRNYQALRKNHPELPEKYQNIDRIAEMLTKILKNNPGVVGLSEHQVVGYLTGLSNIPHFKGSAAGVYIPEWAHASVGNDQALIYYRLYQSIAREWVSNRQFTQAITFFANETTLPEVFQGLCFGLLVIDGLRPMTNISTKLLPGVVIREANRNDLLSLDFLAKNLIQHLNDSPIFLNRKYPEKSMEQLEQDFLGDDVKTWVAEQDGKIVSSIRAFLHQGDCCEIVRDLGTMGINFAFTLPEAHGKGIASGLLAELIEWGQINGMTRCTVDFEAMNQKAVNFWLRHFQPICYSMLRKVDDRINIETKGIE